MRLNLKKQPNNKNMKKISVIVAAVAALVMASCGNGTPKADMKNDVDSLSYAIGMAQTQGLQDYLVMRMGVDTTYMDEFVKGLNEGVNTGSDKKKQAYYAGLQIGQQVSEQMIKGLNMELFGEDSTQTVSLKNFMAGFVAGTLKKDGKMTMEEATKYAETTMRTVKARQMEKNFGENKKAGEEFLAAKAKEEGVKKIEGTGVLYEVLTEGNGEIPADTSVVKVRYEGSLIDGTVFDGNMDAKEPMSIRCTNVIQGWTAALTHMPVGSKWKVYIPQEMAYGEREAGDKIKPFSTLVFVIDLVGIE